LYRCKTYRFEEKTTVQDLKTFFRIPSTFEPGFGVSKKIVFLGALRDEWTLIDVKNQLQHSVLPDTSENLGGFVFLDQRDYIAVTGMTPRFGPRACTWYGTGEDTKRFWCQCCGAKKSKGLCACCAKQTGLLEKIRRIPEIETEDDGYDAIPNFNRIDYQKCVVCRYYCADGVCTNRSCDLHIKQIAILENKELCFAEELTVQKNNKKTNEYQRAPIVTDESLQQLDKLISNLTQETDATKEDIILVGSSPFMDELYLKTPLEIDHELGALEELFRNGFINEENYNERKNSLKMAKEMTPSPVEILHRDYTTFRPDQT